MAKKAFLVDISLRTRVVVDIPDEYADPLENEEIWRYIAHKGTSKIGGGCWDDYLILENVTEIMEDTEMPYDPLIDEV